MKISGYQNNLNISSRSKTVNFERRLTPAEEKDYKQNAIQPALDYLGTKELSMIIHGTCFPEDKKDVGVGSPYGKIAAQLIPFEILHGFNANQLGPVGVIKTPQQISPYKSTTNTKNFLFIDFNELTKDKYANILNDNILNKVLIEHEKSAQNYSYSDFPEAFANSKYLIRTARKNLKEKVAEENPQAQKLNTEYLNFKRTKAKDIYQEALFNTLSDIYDSDDYNTWNDTDKNLINRINNKDPQALERQQKLLTISKEEINDFVFGQFLIEKQIKENTKLRKELGFEYINDLLIGCSKADEWKNQDIFLKDYRLGCPYGGENNGQQFWNIPVLNPKKLFNSDGTLGKAGIYLNNKLETALENFDNIRIDHVIGLIDPYIYNIHTKKGANISQLPEIDPNGNFKRVINEIVLPALEKHGIDKNSPIWEDLGAGTPVFEEIYRHRNNLPGITQLEWSRGEGLKNKYNCGLVGSHDSDPANIMIKKEWVRNSEAWNPLYLAGFLNQNPERAQIRNAFCDRISTDDLERVKAKFAELLYTHQKVQISFADFFGIDQTYNQGGSENNLNWKLRINKDYEQDYYDNLSSEKPTALNMPEILKMAVQAKLDSDTVQYRPHNKEQIENIINNLDKYENILKTPE